jgi:hypothetical protein
VPNSGNAQGFVNRDKPTDWGGTGTLPTTAIGHLANRTWDTVNVEVRRGTEEDCAINAAFETKALDRIELRAVPAPNVDVCYRGDRDPDNPKPAMDKLEKDYLCT